MKAGCGIVGVGIWRPGNRPQRLTPEGHGGSLMDAAALRGNMATDRTSSINYDSNASRRWMAGHATIFPNLSFLSSGALRVWQPRGTREMEIWSWVVVPADASPEQKREIVNSAADKFSTADIFETDDSENWSEIQAVSSGAMSQQVPLNYQMGFGHEGDSDDALRGYDVKMGHILNDIGARGFYRRWAERMDRPEISLDAPAAEPIS